MKTALLLLALCLPASAQTFVNYTLTNFDTYASPEAEKIIDVPTNTIFKVVALQTSGSKAEVYAEYPQSTNLIFISYFQPGIETTKAFILGPAKIHFQGWGQNSNHDICVLLAEFDVVNTAPDLSGLAVQPAGHVATVQIEASTNLTTWQTAPPGNYPATNNAAFYRLKFEVN